ncbi:MAG TPA: hypothetical protein PK385_05485 [Spirochaetota bacterium]|mgnify:CR=1 FL=1|nr:hypothetical protein [Spirochaetota bacterium]HOS32181.1 hypothetical protein [Spirochaetota bacterium]HOS55490.1 hypothetical protein [Spirochaetota bacterium]HPK62006.1 hypothetical protein [Spirochaetota bacterium]HQF78029.1 hypothetical protein [Spirochaetota bacterium]
MKKLLFFALFVFVIPFSLFSKKYSIKEQDIIIFLSLAEEYKVLLSGLLSEEEKNLKLSETFYLDNESVKNETKIFLEKNNWSYEKFENFLYVVGATLDALSYSEVFGNYDDVLLEDISKPSVFLVKKYKSKLAEYFDIENFDLPDPNRE